MTVPPRDVAGALADVIVRAREHSPTVATGLARELLDWLGHVAGPLGPALAEFAGDDRERQAGLADIIGVAARQLAQGDDPPGDPVAAAAWQALVWTADHLHGSGVLLLGRLPFLDDELLGLLLDEARSELQPGLSRGRRVTRPAGEILGRVAVSRQLREAVGVSLGVTVAPTYDAVYEYDPPRWHVRTHVDRSSYEITCHLVLEHARDGERAPSVLVAHLPAARRPRRLEVWPGECVVLRGRGTLHSWQALGDGESRTGAAIGFAPVEPTGPRPSPD